MTDPLVSVVIAAYNAAPFLRETLESVAAQTYGRVEILVVDDGSTDDTAEIAKQVAPNARIFRRERGGLAAARNFGLREASGTFIALLDADDLWMPTKLETQVGVAQRHPSAGLIVCDAEEFIGDRTINATMFRKPFAKLLRTSTDGEVAGMMHRRFLRFCQITCPAQTLFARRVVEEVGEFIDSPAQDFDYYLRASRLFPLVIHREVLARWRYRPDSMSGSRLTRPLRFTRTSAPVLRAHAERCKGEERRIIERRAAAIDRICGLPWPANVLAAQIDQMIG